MYKIKYLLLISLLIIISFLICSLTPPPDTKYDFQISSNIPAEHKIKIINYGHGSVLVDNIQKNNGDIIVCSRFSALKLTVSPDKNYEIDKILYNDKDITSSLNSNVITIENIVKDGSIEFKFKTSSVKPDKPSITNRIINKIKNDKDIIINKTLETTDYLYNLTKDFLSSTLVKTGDLSLPALYLIFIFLVSPAIYIIYYLKRK